MVATTLGAVTTPTPTKTPAWLPDRKPPRNGLSYHQQVVLTITALFRVNWDHK